MSIVRYTKKNGRVAVYESTSNYDAALKQSRPRRKYLGMEDPITHQLIPSSGKRGRKKKSDLPSDSTAAVSLPPAQQETRSLREECMALRKENAALRKENAALRETMNTISSLAARFSDVEK